MQFQNFLSKSTLLLTTTIILSGCIGSKNTTLPNNNIQMPSWYINAPSNNNLYLYGEGEASTLQEAKDNALNSMASRLVVSVGSTMETVTSLSHNSNKEDSYNKNISKNLKVDVQKIKFTNATVQRSQKIDDNFYILMEVDREELFNNKKKEFDINDKQLIKTYNSLDNYGKLEQINILQNIYPKIDKAKKQTVILNAINNSFDVEPYIKRYNRYINTITEIKNNLTIRVISNKKDNYFADNLIDLLNQNNYKVNYNKSDVTIKMDSKIKHSIARGWNIAKISTTLSIISNNKVISNKVIYSIGRSSTSQESAIQSASISFMEQIKKQTLNNILFNK
ncbi:MAG: LPP20 family lipoprotein [Campylobacterota bacterium]|nr:LPP20 family lipoprotein [Campylobacterota bacterium]